MPLLNIPLDKVYYIPVDGSLLERENGWAAYEQREPGCLGAFFRAYLFISEDLDSKELTVPYIRTIHALCSETRDLNQRGEICPSTLHKIHLSAHDCSQKGVKEHLDNLEKKYSQELEQIRIQCPNENAEEIYKTMELDEVLGGTIQFREGFQISPSNVASRRSELQYKDNEEFSHFIYEKILEEKSIKLLTTEDFQNRLMGLYEITDSYNLAIQNADTLPSKLKIIIKTICDFERLHPFADHNNRTFVNLLLTRLLLQNGFDTPLIFYRPNAFDLHSVDELIKITLEAIENGKKLSESQPIFKFNPDDVSSEIKAQFEIISNNFSLGITEEIKERIQNYTRKFLSEDIIMKLITDKTMEYISIQYPELQQNIGSIINNYYSNKNLDNFNLKFKDLLQELKCLSERDSDVIVFYKKIQNSYQILDRCLRKKDLALKPHGSPISRPIYEGVFSCQYNELRERNKALQLNEEVASINPLTPSSSLA